MLPRHPHLPLGHHWQVFPLPGLPISPSQMMRSALFEDNLSSRALRRGVSRLNVINRLKQSFDTDGSLTKEGNEIYQLYFTGEKAWFSDSSDTEKQKFKEDLTFVHPGRPREKNILYLAREGEVSAVSYSFLLASDCVYAGLRGLRRAQRLRRNSRKKCCGLVLPCRWLHRCYPAEY